MENEPVIEIKPKNRWRPPVFDLPSDLKELLYSKKIAVVVPCYNEESQIGMVIETMPDFINYIVIADDCSKDRTREVIKDYQKTFPQVVLIEHKTNQGVGGGIASGYKWAAQNDVDIAVVMAGDGQMNPAELPDIIKPVITDEADYSKANRLVVSDVGQKIPKIRLFGNSVLSFLTKIASGYWHIVDSQTGYTAINRRALKTIDWDKMYKRYGQPNDLLVRLNVYNFRVRDVVSEPVYNVGEQSKLKVRRVVFSISLLLVRLFFWRLKEKYIIREFHPLVLFYVFGFFMSALSTGLFVRLIYLWTMNGYVPEMTAMSWMFATGMSLQSIFFAMLFDMESNKHLR